MRGKKCEFLKIFFALLAIYSSIKGHAQVVVLPGQTYPPVPSVGVFPVTGSYTQESGGIYLATVNSQGYSSIISVFGTPGVANLNGGILQLQLNNANFLLNTPYPILTATGGINGGFESTLTNLNSALVPFLAYNSNIIFLTLTTDFSSEATTGNQRHVSAVLDDNQNAQGDFLYILQNLLETPQEFLPRALDELSGQQYTSLIPISRVAVRRFLRDLFDPILFASNSEPNDCFECEDSYGLDVWGTAHYGRSFLEDNYKAKGYKVYSADALVAVQKTFNEYCKLGLAAFYENNRVNYNLRGYADVNSIQGALYGLYEDECFYALANIAVGFHHYNVSRKIKFHQINRIAIGKPKVYDTALYAECGYTFQAADYFQLQPFIGIEGGYFWYNSFHESGANAADLTTKRKNLGIGDSRLGLRINATLLGDIVLSSYIAWNYAFCQDDTKIKLHFEEVGQEFNIRGHKIKPNAVEGSVYLGKKILNDTTLFAEGYGLSSGNFSNYSFTLGIDFSI